MLTLEQRNKLLTTAAASIRHGFTHDPPYKPDHKQVEPNLLQPRAVFVTLHQGDKLRGCVGTLTAESPLIDAVSFYACRAAFRDLRFSPLTSVELTDLHIHVSVLSTPETVQCDTEAELVAQLQPGVDGLILEKGPHCATFLPSVWEQIRSPELFVRQLKLKAGLAEIGWDAGIRVKRYRTESFGEYYSHLVGPDVADQGR